MASIPSISVDASQRARRWDAIVLGSGVASLIAAARLGMQELRVLVVEEQTATDLPVCLREPPLFAGCGEGAVLDSVLHELRVPLIDRRRFVSSAVGFQIVGPDLRMDVGKLGHTASELVTWGLAKPDPAQALLRALDEAAEQERELLLGATLVRMPGLRGLARSSAAGATRARSSRGLPSEVSEVGAELGRILAAQVRAMGNHAEGGPNSEACARLLGTSLRGGLELGSGGTGLIPVLRRRVEALYGEFRSIDSSFDLISSSGLPGLRQRESGELWLARALVIGSSAVALGAATQEPAWAGLRVREASARRRSTLHWQLPRDMLPEGMAERLILLSEPGASDPQQGVATLCVSGAGPRSRTVDLVARLLCDEGQAIAANGVPRAEDLEPAADRIEALLHELMPFAGDALVRQSIQLPHWDDDDWLEDTPAGAPWPGEANYRVSSRPPVYRLDRPAVAALGLEGDMMLGWRSGDAIAAEFR